MYMYARVISICAIDQYAYIYISVWIEQIHVHVPIEKDTTDTVLLLSEKDREGCQAKIKHVHISVCFSMTKMTTLPY